MICKANPILGDMPFGIVTAMLSALRIAMFLAILAAALFVAATPLSNGPSCLFPSPYVSLGVMGVIQPSMRRPSARISREKRSSKSDGRFHRYQ